MVCLIRYVALGFANIFSAITGGYPISGSFSRTALNDEVGATSPISVLVVAILVGIITKIASIAPVSATHPLIASDHLPNLISAAHPLDEFHPRITSDCHEDL